ncbi:hypothetical protein [Leifsonia sp. Leaf264]|uniref:hypothetical protein n=1 Tax=Leifsonia sp. Leaf264 TaxID=1736314 RepID=UPI0006FF369C|nr:hypothetical protein [Leifsonia sp. Leaf264]KQP01898.1 hypothetical protein ASF30_04915 [Leifsonia sp. Leaf264]
MPSYDLTARLRAALDHGDDLALVSVLHRDVSLVTDSGDESGGEVSGRMRVVSALHDLQTRHPDAGFFTANVNGQTGLALRRSGGEVIGVLSVEGATAIAKLWLCTSPPKLASWNRRHSTH